MNDEHEANLLKLLPKSKIDWKHVAVTAKIDAQGNFCLVGSLPYKIKAARDDESINTVVIAENQIPQEQRNEFFKKLSMVERDEFNDINLNFTHSFYSLPNRDFWVVVASLMEDCMLKLYALQHARWPKIDLNLPCKDTYFTGRKRLFEAVTSYVDTKDAGYLVIISDMGRGKTAFMTELIHQAKESHSIFGAEPPLYHFVPPTPDHPQSAEEVAENLYTQLRRNHQIYDDRTEGKTAAQKLHNLMLELSPQLQSEGRKQLILLDAADQLGTNESLLFGAFRENMPPGFFCVITSRPNDHWLNYDAKGDKSVVHIVRFDDEIDGQPLVDDRTDIREYLSRMNNEFSLGIKTSIIEQVTANHEKPPVFFVVQYLTNVLRGRKDMAGLVDENNQPLTAERLQCEVSHWIVSVDAHIKKEIRHLRVRAKMAEDDMEEFVMRVLAVLIVAREDLSRNMLESLAFKGDKPKLKKALELTRNFFVYQKEYLNDTRYVFGHPHYSRVIQNYPTVQQELRECHELLADGCDKWDSIESDSAYQYALKYRMIHRLNSYSRTDKCWQKLADAFADIEYIETRSEKHGFYGIYHDAREAMRVSRERIQDNHWQDWPPAFQDWELFLRLRLEFFRRNYRMYPQEIVNEFQSNRMNLCQKLKDSSLKYLKKHFWLQKIAGPLAYQPVGHAHTVTSLAVSPKNDLIVSGDLFGMIKVWDMETSQFLHDLRGHTSVVYSVSFSPDGCRVVSGSQDGTAKIWDTETGELLHNLREHTDWVFSVAFSPDGCRVVSGSQDGTVKTWDAETGQLLHDLQDFTDAPTSFAFSPDCRLVASGSGSGDVSISDIASGQLLHDMHGHTHHSDTFAFSPDGRLVVSGGWDNLVRIWDVETGELLHTLGGHIDCVWSVAFSPDSRRVVSGSFDKTVKIWDAETGQLLHTLRGHTGKVESVVFSSNCHLVVSGSDDRTFKIWDAETGQLLHDYRGYFDCASSASFSHDGRCAVSSFVGKTLQIWDAEAGELLHDLQGHTAYVRSISFSPDGRRVVSGDFDHTVKIWDTETGKLLHDLQGHTSYLESVVFSSDCRHVVSQCLHVAKIWDAETGELLHTLEGYDYGISSVAFSPDCRRVVSGSRDESVKIWDAETGQLLRYLRGHTKKIGHGNEIDTVASSQDGCYVVSITIYGRINIWDAEAEKLLSNFRGFLNDSESYENDASFSPDGQHLVLFLTEGGKIIVCQNFSSANFFVLDFQEHYSLKRNENKNFSSTKEYFISLGYDGMLKIWPWPSDKAPLTASLATLFFSSNSAGACFVEPELSEKPTLIRIVTESGDFYTYKIVLPHDS